MGDGTDAPRDEAAPDAHAPEQPEPEGQSRPISVDRVRELLKTKRREAGAGEPSPDETPGRRPGIALFPKPDDDRPAGRRAKVMPLRADPAPEPGEKKGMKPPSPPPQGRPAASPAPTVTPKRAAKAPERRSERPPRPSPKPSAGHRPPEPPHAERRADPEGEPRKRVWQGRGRSWFSSQPEMRWFEPDEPEPPEDDWPDGAVGPEGPDLPPPPRSFTDIDRNSWFANQPEVQRLVQERGDPGASARVGHWLAPAGDRWPATAAEPREPALEAGPYARSAYSGAPHAFEADGNGRPLASEPSPWFAAQPEYQRMRGRSAARRDYAGSRTPRWLIGLTALVAAVTLAIVLLSMVTDLGGRGIGALTGRDGPEVRIEPTAARGDIAADMPTAALPPRQEPAAAPGWGARAPTAPPQATPAPKAGQVTVLTRRPPQPAPAAAEPAPRAASGPAAEAPAAAGARFDREAGESVFAPSAPAWVDQPGGGSPDDPFSSFSSEGGPRIAPPPAAPPEPQAAAPAVPATQTAGLGAEAIAGGVAIERQQVATALDQARARLRERDLAGAGQILRDIIAADPQNLDALRLYGDVLVLERRLGPALEIFDAALAIEPGDASLRLNQGTTLIALGRPAEAMAAAQSVIDAAPESVAAYGLRSKASAALGDMAQAMNDCDRIGTLSASKSAVEWCRAEAQNHSGNHFVAVRMFISALNSGEQGFVRGKQVYLQNLGLYNGPVDGLANQQLVDAVTSCTVARDCVL